MYHILYGIRHVASPNKDMKCVQQLCTYVKISTIIYTDKPHTFAYNSISLCCYTNIKSNNFISTAVIIGHRYQETTFKSSNDLQ